MIATREYRIPRHRMLAWLEELENAPDQVACVYLPARTPLDEVEKVLAPLGSSGQAPPHLAETIAASATGAALFHTGDRGWLVLPPFPIAEPHYLRNFHVEPLQDLLNQKLTIALVLLRLGQYAVGVFRSEELLTSKVGAGNIHSRHRQGGSSSHRFEHHRDKQIETFFTRVCGHAREKFEPYEREVNWLIYGGVRETILAFRKQCRFLGQFDNRVLARHLEVREPKQATLEGAIEQVWSSRVIEWQPE